MKDCSVSVSSIMKGNMVHLDQCLKNDFKRKN